MPYVLKPVFAANIDVQSNHLYIASDDNTPVAVAILSVLDDIGHLNSAATLPGYRGRHSQAALIQRRLEDGFQLGCKQFLSETWLPGNEPNRSSSNLQNAGFEVLYQRPNWVLQQAH